MIFDKNYLEKKEQMKSELRTIIKNSKKGIFCRFDINNLIEISRRICDL